MYVCLCNAYRSHEIREVAREGAETVEDAYLMLGEGPCCGRCVSTAQAMINEERLKLDPQPEGGGVPSPAAHEGSAPSPMKMAYQT